MHRQGYRTEGSEEAKEVTIRKVLQLSLGFSLFISIVLHVCTELVMALLLSGFYPLRWILLHVCIAVN